MPHPPRVTVGVPVYNGAEFLAEALRAVQDQTFTDLEIVVSDNASTDATPQIVEAAAAHDPRVRLLRHERNRGGAWNWNHLLRQARGEYFLFAAADDLRHPDFVERCVAALDLAGPGTVLAYPRTRIIDAAGSVTEDLHDQDEWGNRERPHARLRDFLRAQAGHLVYGVFRTDALRATRGLARVSGGDLVLVAEVAMRGRFVLVPEQLFLQRRHARQSSARGAAIVHFHAPGRDPRFDFSHTKITVELVRGVLAAPAGAGEKARCVLAVLGAWTLPRWRGTAADVRRALLGR